MTVHTVEDAKNWFFENHNGTILCEREKEQIECDSFPKAKAWFSTVYNKEEFIMLWDFNDNLKKKYRKERKR